MLKLGSGLSWVCLADPAHPVLNVNSAWSCVLLELDSALEQASFSERLPPPHIRDTTFCR
eukprot:5384466-Amphidinium_carterae.1